MDFDSNNQDLEPLAKRVRLDTGDSAISIHSPITGVLEQDGDDADSDFYGDDTPSEPVSVANGIVCADLLQNGERNTSPRSGIPGLLMIDEGGDGSETKEAERDEASRQLEVEHIAAKDTTDSIGEHAVAKALPQAVPDMKTSSPPKTEANNAAAAAADASDDVDMENSDVAADRVAPEEGEVVEDTEKAEDSDALSSSVKSVGRQTARGDAPQSKTKEEKTGRDDADTTPVKKEAGVDPLWVANMLKGPDEKPHKPPPDPEFMALAAAQKGDENAEWRYDTSDAESSNSGQSSDSDHDSGDESGEEYTGMKPEDIAKVLMQEDFNDDGPSTGAAPLRTKNEMPEDQKVERPNIVVTPEMKIEALGKVESIVDNMVLIKASVSGEYQVLSESSLLVLADKSVIGVVADTLGRVEEPLYTVRFNSAEEIKELKVEEGKDIYYVPEHSTYVFTKPLLAQKGTDASNLYDEEAGESEQEFSDDEAEAEYKKKKKEARKNVVDKKFQRGDRKLKSWAPAEPPAPVGPATLNYDEPYVPLQRPANLHELASQPPPPPPSSLRARGRGGKGGDRGDRSGFRGRGNDRGRSGNRGRGNDGRGRGNDRGRGRGFDRGPGGDRGRGGHGYDRGGHDGVRGGQDGGRGGQDGGRGGQDGGRGGRGGRDHPRNRSPRAQRDQFKPQSHDSSTSPGAGHTQQQQIQGQNQGQNQGHQTQGYPHPPPLPQFPSFPQTTNQSGWQQPPSFPSFPQFSLPFQFPGMPPIPPPPPPPQPQMSGAHVNPHFFGPQSPPVQQQQQPQAQAQVPAWMQGFVQPQPQQDLRPPQQSTDDAFRALQNTLAFLRQQQQQQQQQ